MRTFRVLTQGIAQVHPVEIKAEAMEIHKEDRTIRFISDKPGVVAVFPLDKLVAAFDTETCAIL